MAKFSLDMKHFKKIGGDGESTTLRHANGHTMTVVHSALAPEHRELFKALPAIAQAAENKPQQVQHYDEGTPDGGASNDVPINVSAPDMGSPAPQIPESLANPAPGAQATAQAPQAAPPSPPDQYGINKEQFYANNMPAEKSP